MISTPQAAALIPPEIAAEAAVWISRLHGPNRSAELEQEFSSWLEHSPLHQLAFERSTGVWDSVSGISAAVAFSSRTSISAHRSHRAPRLVWGGLGLVGSLLAVYLSWSVWFADVSYTTRVGEQRTLTLVDGSRVALNTNTHLTIAKRDDIRLVKLDSGEAFFEVAKDPGHPFIVDAGSQKITAIGTAFSVRRDGEKVSVTLVEGKIAVSKVVSVVTKTVSRPEAKPGVQWLDAGQRIVSTLNAETKLDVPAVEQVTAWRRGEVILDNTPLTEAIAEMNRYSNLQLVITDPAIQKMSVSGIFRAGDTEAFARATASVHGLEVVAQPGRIILSRR